MPDRWTAPLVEAYLVACFAALPSTPVYSPVAGEYRTLGDGRRVFSMVAASARYLGRDERVALMTWAASAAMPDRPSVGEICREKDWNRASFERQRREAADRLAAALNADDVPVTAFGGGKTRD